jgi:hypothetical protein
MRTDADSKAAGSLSEGIAQLYTESDRSVGIIAGTIVELTLAAALKAYMHPNEKITDPLFLTTGPLGAFGTKIDLGFLIGIYGQDAHRDLVTMKDIRNRFAHSLAVKDFNSQQVRAWSMNLKLVERHTAQAQGAIGHGGVATSESPRTSQIWIGTNDRDKTLSDPRERYLLSAQVFCAGLSPVVRTGMPSPLF